MVTKKEEAREELRLWISHGWKLKEETKEQYVLTKNTQKVGIHLIIFAVMAMMSMSVPTSGSGGEMLMPFLGNIVYYFLSNKKKTIVK